MNDQQMRKSSSGGQKGKVWKKMLLCRPSDQLIAFLAKSQVTCEGLPDDMITCLRAVTTFRERN